MREVDVAIVGAGPAGLFGAYYAGFRGLSTTLIDALPEPGGQVSAMYPEKVIYDVAGFPAIRGRDLVKNLVEQAAQFEPEYRLGVRAESVSYVDGKPVLALSDGETLHCGAIIITGGLGSFTARPLPAAASFAGDGLVYFVPRLDDLAGHHVVIVGGGDSAFDWALSLQPVAKFWTPLLIVLLAVVSSAARTCGRCDGDLQRSRHRTEELDDCRFVYAIRLDDHRRVSDLFVRQGECAPRVRAAGADPRRDHGDSAWR